MAKIISVSNQKGGVGKSTVTLLAATALSSPPFSYKVAVVDVDPQKSISTKRRDDLEDYQGVLPYDVLPYNWQTFQEKIQDLESMYQLIFVDVAGKLDNYEGKESEAVQALQYVDLVLVPFTMGNFNTDATLEYLKVALSVKAHRPDIEILAFKNMYRRRSRHGKQLLEDLTEVERLANVPVMKTSLRRYVDYEDANSIDSLYHKGRGSATKNFSEWLDELHSHIIE